MYNSTQRLSPEDSLALYNLIHMTARLFEEAGVTYWAVGGTLLGAVRNKGIMPHDNDADLNIYASDAQYLRGKTFTEMLRRNGLKLGGNQQPGQVKVLYRHQQEGG